MIDCVEIRKLYENETKQDVVCRITSEGLNSRMKAIKEHDEVSVDARIKRLHYAMIEGYMQPILWCVQ